MIQRYIYNGIYRISMKPGFAARMQKVVLNEWFGIRNRTGQTTSGQPIHYQNNFL